MTTTETDVAPAVEGFARATQAFDVLSARLNRDPVVGCSVEESNRFVAHLFVLEVARVARRIERQVRREFRASRAMQALKAPHARIQGGHASLGEAHEADAGRIDPGMLGKQLQRAEGVDHHRQ